MPGRSPLYRALGRALTTARAANLRANGDPPAVTRRQVLRGAAAMGALAVAGCVSETRLRTSPRIAIVGGGLAGLSAAWHLQKVRFAARVYEAAGRVGGRTASIEASGLTLNMGAEFIDSDHGDMLTLARELGIALVDRREESTDEAVPAVAFYFGGRSIPESELSEALRPFAVAIGSDADRLDKDPANVRPALDRMSVAEYLDRHMGLLLEPYLRPLMETAIRSEFGVEAVESSALQLIGLLPTVDGQRVDVLGATDEAFVVQGGSASIAEALAARLGDRIETGRQLERIQVAGEFYRLGFADGAAVDADYVVLAIPNPPLRRVNIQAELPPKLRRFIAVTGPGANEKSIALFRRRAWRQPAGFAGEAWSDLGFCEVWDASAGQPERADGALTFFVGARETESGDAASFLTALGHLVPGLATAATGRTMRTHWSDDPLAGGAYTNLKPGQATEFAEFFWSQDRAVRAGRLFFAGEQLSEAYYGYMNGAAETGRLAAAAIARDIDGA